MKTATPPVSGIQILPLQLEKEMSEQVKGAHLRDFPGGPVVHASTAGGVGSISSWGTNILHAACPPPTPSKGRFPIAGDFWRHEEVTPSPCHQIPLILCLELPCGVLVEVFLHHRPSAHLDGRFQNLLTRACLHRHERSSSLTSHADFLLSEFLSFSVQWILRIILY